jgi:hypothetical protein
MAAFHRRALPLDAICLKSFGLRTDGSVVLTRVLTSNQDLENTGGVLPPELRRRSSQTITSLELETSKFRTDMFRLGLVLRRLAQHKATTYGEFCARDASTAFPRFMCKADHRSPINSAVQS